MYVDSFGNLVTNIGRNEFPNDMDALAIVVNFDGAVLKAIVRTYSDAQPGEVVALSGLVNGELSNAIDKVPGLGNIPILGRLFRSDDFRSKKSDLVVLLEPEIIVAGQGIAEQLRQRGMENKQEFERRVAPPPPPPARTPDPEPSLR